MWRWIQDRERIGMPLPQNTPVCFCERWTYDQSHCEQVLCFGLWTPIDSFSNSTAIRAGAKKSEPWGYLQDIVLMNETILRSIKGLSCKNIMCGVPKIEVPPNHPFLDGIFSINHPAIGVPPWLWKPPCVISRYLKHKMNEIVATVPGCSLFRSLARLVCRIEAAVTQKTCLDRFLDC